MARLRLALTISGAVSLGAYEGGALAALLVAVQHLLDGDDPPVQVDAIAGASAGAITGLLAARVLLAGQDPVEVMHRAWVEADSLDALLRDATLDAPLSTRSLAATAGELLRLPSTKTPQRVPVSLHLALASLHGLHYKVATLGERGRGEIDATTYLDWGRFTFEPGDGPERYTTPRDASAIDVALASAANALGFPPRRLDRTTRGERQDPEAYEDNGIEDAPPFAWYTDGGTIDNEPLGRTIDLVTDIDTHRAGAHERMIVLVHPHPSAPRPASEWTDPSVQPGWTKTLLRAQDIQRTQSLYEDLRRLEKTNSRSMWAGALGEELAPLVATMPDEERRRWGDAARRVLDLIHADLEEVRAIEGRPARPAPHVGVDDTAQLLDMAVRRVSGLGGKGRIGVEVISPQALANDPEYAGVPVERLLAGEFLFHFGGFLDRAYRESDFDLGYLSTTRWLEAMAGERAADFPLAGAIDAVRRAHVARPVVERDGRGRPLAPAAKVGLARVAARTVAVVVRERVWRRRR